jgi:voltage-gated potassium channel
MSGTMDSAKDERGFRALTAALMLLLGFQLLALQGLWNPIAMSVLVGAALTASLWWVHRRPFVFWVGVVLLLPALGGGWLLSEQAVVGVGGSPFHAPYFFYLATTVLVRVLQSKRATEDTLLGSACAYILMSLAFASAYEAVEFFSPGAIAGLDPSGASGTVFSQFSYFSLVTLTTLGYGDLAPIHPFCQSLAIVESVVGVLFPALIVARIIGAHSVDGANALESRESEWTREGRVTQILFVFLPAIVLALPWVQQTVWGGVVVAGLLLSMMVAGVYFISGRVGVLVAGVGISLTACALRVLGGDFVLLAVVLEVALIGVVVGRMTFWFFRRDEATTSVILAAACIYWMIGIGFAEAFGFIGHFFPAAIEGSDDDPLGAMLYFSFMTLTTTGYGDFSPAIPMSRSLAALEAFIGVFYPAIVISKLVSLYGKRR